MARSPRPGSFVTESVYSVQIPISQKVFAKVNFCTNPSTYPILKNKLTGNRLLQNDFVHTGRRAAGGDGALCVRCVARTPRPGSHLAQSVHDVVLQKSIPAQNRQLIL